jgi:hypothetical protein
MVSVSRVSEELHCKFATLQPDYLRAVGKYHTMAWTQNFWTYLLAERFFLFFMVVTSIFGKKAKSRTTQCLLTADFFISYILRWSRTAIPYSVRLPHILLWKLRSCTFVCRYPWHFYRREEDRRRVCCLLRTIYFIMLARVPGRTHFIKFDHARQIRWENAEVTSSPSLNFFMLWSTRTLYFLSWIVSVWSKGLLYNSSSQLPTSTIIVLRKVFTYSTPSTCGVERTPKSLGIKPQHFAVSIFFFPPSIF